MTTDIIQDIRRQCRMAMNGIASTSMRNHGLNYKLNFGVSLLKIKDIAKRYNPNVELAETLWKEDTRELKILATLLYPLDSFDKTTATNWLEGVNNQEIREQLCMNLLQNLPYASQLCLEWSNSTSDETRITGYWLLSRLILVGKIEDIKVDLLTHILFDVKSDNVSMYNASLQALKLIGRNSKHDAKKILEKLSVFQHSGNIREKEAFKSLSFEYEFYNSN